ncbi:MAG: hypothetical protein J5601_05570 [Elusimicrobiaceae bacterium]|nr:hypothetical protein [Elusimicrobiaceae bacterium]
MKKIASLFISFTLLFTQLAPLAEATNIKIINQQIITDFSMITMLKDPGDPRWLSVESLEEMVNFLAQHPEMTHNPRIKELIRSKVRIIATHCEQFFFVASQTPIPMDPLCDDNVQENLLTIVKEPFEFNGIQTDPFPEEVVVVKEVPQQVLEEKNTNNTIYVGTIGKGIASSSEDEAILRATREIARQHKPSTPKNEDYFLLENADFSYLPSIGTDDIPAELKELIRALNQATDNGIELDKIMEEAIRAYLDPQYKGAGIFPPSYLSLLFKLYMDKVTSFQKAWSYVEVNTPASSKCQGTKCDDISRFAMEALLMQPRFREQLSQEQWTFIDGIINKNLSKFEKGSKEYITEMVKNRILKEGKEKVQQELESIITQAIAEGKSKEEATGLAMAVLLATSSEAITGEVLSSQLSAQLLAQWAEEEALLRELQVAIIESPEEFPALFEAIENLASTGEEAAAGAAGGTAASVIIPVAVIGLFTIGVGYALYDAYGFKSPDAKRHMINYVNSEISNQVPLTKTAPQSNTSSSGKTMTPTAPSTQNPGNPNNSRNNRRRNHDTCAYRYKKSPNSWTLGEAEGKLENTKDQDKFRNIMEDCGFNYTMKIGDLPLSNDYKEKKEENECDSFVLDLQEIDYVKDSFISLRRQRPLYTRIQFKGTSLLPAPELPIKAMDQIDLIEITAQWFKDNARTLLGNFFRALRGADDLSNEEFKGIRRGPHERKFDNGYLHFHYEELKHYVYNGEEFPYICNHAVKYKPGFLSGIDDAVSDFFK